MKTRLLKSIATVVLILNFINGYSQCSVCALTIATPNSGTYDLSLYNSGQTICITGSGAFTGRLNNFNGNTLCIGTGVTYNPSTAPNYNGNWTIINNGTFSNVTNLNFNTGTSFTNGATGTISFGSNITISSGCSFSNLGTMTLTGSNSFTVNSLASVTLGGTTTIGGTLTNNGNISVQGSITAATITNNSSGSVIGGAGANCNYIKATGTFTNNGIYGGSGNGLYVGNTGGTITSPATSTVPTAPTTQPTSLNLSISGSTISGSFTQTSTASDGYVILRAIATTPPATTNPTNIASLVVGQTLGSWTVVAINAGQTTTTFTDNIGVTCTNVNYRIYSFKTAGTSLCRVYNTTSPLTATFSPIPSITGTTPATRCGSGTLTLGATASAGTINWYAAASGGASLGTGTSFTTPSIATTTTYYVDATNNGCTTASRTAVIATVNTIPTITGTTPATRCGSGTLTLGATPSAGTINWYAAATGGTSLGTGTSFTTPSLSTTTTYYVDATNNGCTTATRTAVVATVNDPTITSTTPGTRNGTGTVVLGATASVGTINWYAAATGGVSLGSGTSFTTPSISTTTTYYVEAVNGACTSTPRVAVVATVNQPEINIQGNGISIPTGTITTTTSNFTNFSSTDVTYGTITKTFVISNIGTSTLNLSIPTISGTNASEFTVTANPSLTVNPSSSTSFSVTFDPTATGVRTATINIVNDDPNENPYTFAISGIGITDIDGDSIDASSDIDNDNDGILDTIECAACVSDPFINGSFETTTPLLTGSTYAFFPVANVAGWQSSPENVIEIWSSGFNGVTAANGNQFAELNANLPGTLYQTFCLNGASGTITWSLKHRGRVGTDQAFVRFGPTLALAQASAPVATLLDGNTAWGSYSGTYTIPAGQTQIVIAFQAGVTATGDQSVGNFLDDVQITIVQGCVDSDGDGIADADDLDSDNDGIPDIEEAGFKAYSNNTSTMYKATSSTWLDANSNGMNDYIDSMISGGTYAIPDTDGDGIKNQLDLDSDNDAAFDVDEAGLLNGDGDINGDGKGDGTDTDKDGILDLYDNSTSYGTTTRAYAQDTDSNGVSDYLQLDSNSDGIKDIQAGLYASLDANNDGKIDGSTDVDKDGIIDTFDTNTAAIGSPRDLNRKLQLEFDGRNDYGQENVQILDNLANASLMAWVDLNSAFSTDGVIIGQNNFQIRVTSARNIQAIANGTTLTYSTVALNTNQWYHIGAVYGGGLLKLFLNGTMVASVAATGNIISDGSKLTIGKDPSTNTKYLKAKLDEIRVFNVALADVYFQRMVYQEIQNTSSQTRGKIIPSDIGVPFANVLRCFSMDAYKNDVIDDITTASIDVTGMKIYNNKNIYVQQAPMPFVTERTGNFATAVNSPTNEVRGLDIMDQDWSIVQVKHDITETTNNVDLGMIVDAGKTVTMNNDTKIQNDWYLLLNGKIDLQGKSQLIQTVNSVLDVTSAGSIERDQQGTKNIYNYNYWASPVGTMNTTSNNNSFTVAGVLKDGTTGTPQNITWTSGLNGSPTSPITLSSYWIFKFQNLTNSYANWATVGQNGTLNVAQGFTLKGSGTASANQNYTFVGKPNNGTITTTVAAGNLNLTGNPYPSALDSSAFITANNATTTGTLYFWEHSATNNTHNLVNYQGGYSVRNLVGGTGPTAPANINGLGTSSKIPGRFIPVGQGFFVVGSATGGNITFNNNQRFFIKEDNAASTYMFKNTATNILANDNSEDQVTTDNFKRVRLGLTSKDNYHRQILLGFMEQNATSAIESGYDAPNIDNQLNDMYFINSGVKLNIEGEGFFDVNNTYPIGIKTNVFGEVKIMVDATENMDSNQRLFILDNTNGEYHDITNNPYIVELPQGLTDNRFTLTFKDNHTTLNNNNFDLSTGISVAFSNASNILNIKNNVVDTTVEKVSLFNMLGQIVTTFDVKDQNQQNIQLPIKDLSSGTYIVKVKTDKGETTRKIVFN